jgi:hypothetical protein
MTNSNGLALTTETRKSNMNNYGDHVLLEILAKSFGRNVWHGTPGQFRTAHPTLVEVAFKTLSLLELVKPDQDSPWGYRPTSNLTYQLLNPLTDRDKEHADEDDQKLLKKIIQASGKPELWEGGKSLSNMLVVLRLAHWSKETNELIPTEWLHIEWATLVGIDDDE